MIHLSYYDVLALPGDDEPTVVVADSSHAEGVRVNPRATTFCQEDEIEVPVRSNARLGAARLKRMMRASSGHTRQSRRPSNGK